MPIQADERRRYIEKYGKSKWENAVERATGHRSRAINDYGLTDHFTAMEWLDLCAVWDFQCPFCGSTPENYLTPHHCLPLSRCGSNEIENILPICRDCHTFIHDFRINCHSDWLPRQIALCETFQVGDWVCHSHQPDARSKVKLTAQHQEAMKQRQARRDERQALLGDEPKSLGVIAEVVPPMRRDALGDLRGIFFVSQGHTDGIGVINSKITYWARSQAKIRWASRPPMMTRDQYEMVDLEDLEKVDSATDVGAHMASLNRAHTELSDNYTAQHQLLCQFKVGEWVDYGDPARPHQGVILDISAPELHSFDFPLADTNDLELAPWPRLVPASARLKWLNRKGLPSLNSVRVPLTEMKKAREIPALDERWERQWERWDGLSKSRSLRQAVKAAKEASRRKG